MLQAAFRLSFRWLGLVAALFVANVANAYDLRSDEGGVKAFFKAEPTFNKIKGTYQPDKSEFTQYQWLLDEGEKAWLVTYTDYRPGTVAKVGADKFAEGVIKGVIAGTKGTQVGSTKRIVNSTLSGREFLEVIGSNSQHYRERFFIKDGRLYQIIYVGPLGTSNSAEVQTFFDSVHIDH